MSKHTQGPWKAESYREPYNAHELTHHVVSDGLIVAKCGTGFETKENALLIAAAPELLEALQDAAETFRTMFFRDEVFRDHYPWIGESLKKADAAIAKTGGGNDAD